MSKIETPPIAIIIPCYNESNSIKQLISQINHTMKDYNYRVIIIDDGSKDDSYSILQKEIKPGISLYKNKRNSGKGFTLRHGFTLVSFKELVVVIDGDGEHLPEDIPMVISPILKQTADMVIGSRFMKIKKGNIEYRSSYLNNQKKFGQVRKLGNFIFSFLVFIFHKRYITDTQSGFRAFRPGLVKTINLKSDGFQIETELTIKMLKKGWRIGETPIFNGISTRGSHMKMIMDSLKIVGVILENTFSERTKAIFKSLFRRFYMK